ncbi:rhamnosyltransferase [Burkholderia multivorans]
MKKVTILGIRGIPAEHGGFETFAEVLALHLKSRGWDVTVYCQGEGKTGAPVRSTWQGIELIRIDVPQRGALGTLVYDWRCVRHVLATRGEGAVLSLGYNTASFYGLLRLFGIRNVINMDGLEWKRDKWSLPERIWLWCNERLGCWFGNHLIADHPEIARHLATRVSEKKISVIPYGAFEIDTADEAHIRRLDLEPHRYLTLIARPEPENSILEIVRAFSDKPRGVKLVVLGHYLPDEIPFHAAVVSAASDEVVFAGAIYDQDVVRALRHFSLFYLHGHRVGGTNPSLVEALGAGSAVLAHDNCFNRWVADQAAEYFSDEASCSQKIDHMLSDPGIVHDMRQQAMARFERDFRWESVLGTYERLLETWQPPKPNARGDEARARPDRARNQESAGR